MSDVPAPSSGGYNTTAKVLHWTVAACVLGLITLGLLLDAIPQGPAQDFAYMIHKSTGFLVLVLMLLRLIWRLMNPPPPPEPSMEPWRQAAASATHYAFYALLIAMPIIGWAGSNAYGAPVNVYGLFTLPTILDKNEDLSKQIFWWHETFGLTVGALVLLHAGAALHHRFVRKDAVLARMT